MTTRLGSRLDSTVVSGPDLLGLGVQREEQRGQLSACPVCAHSLVRTPACALPCPHSLVRTAACALPCPHSCPQSCVRAPARAFPCPHSHVRTLLSTLPCPHSRIRTPMSALPCPHCGEKEPTGGPRARSLSRSQEVTIKEVFLGAGI